jgi:hypothetical protein
MCTFGGVGGGGVVGVVGGGQTGVCEDFHEPRPRRSSGAGHNVGLEGVKRFRDTRVPEGAGTCGWVGGVGVRG